jgi:hypothetical protein
MYNIDLFFGVGNGCLPRARMQLDPATRKCIDSSDIAQQTMLEAHARGDAFQGDDLEVYKRE